MVALCLFITRADPDHNAMHQTQCIVVTPLTLNLNLAASVPTIAQSAVWMRIDLCMPHKSLTCWHPTTTYRRCTQVCWEPLMKYSTQNTMAQWILHWLAGCKKGGVLMHMRWLLEQPHVEQLRCSLVLGCMSNVQSLRNYIWFIACGQGLHIHQCISQGSAHPLFLYQLPF